MTGDEKRTAYRELRLQIDGLASEGSDAIATMANVAAAVHAALPYSSWTGFYRVVRPELLRVGPFQGPVACVDIPFDRGVCGAAARSGATQIVEDVHAFAGHVACDPEARSEIVVPVKDAAGKVQAVLDLDSHAAAAFDDVDREALEWIVHRIAPRITAA